MRFYHAVIKNQNQLKMSYGNIKVGVGTGDERDIAITEFIQVDYTDDRTVTVAELENEDYLIMVENKESTGREPKVKMWLSKDSFISALSTGILYLHCKGENIGELFRKVIDNKDVIECQYYEGLAGDFVKEKVYNGLSFCSKFFDGKCVAYGVDKDKNTLKVAICATNGSRVEDWDLQHTIWGFERGDYYECDTSNKEND